MKRILGAAIAAFFIAAPIASGTGPIRDYKSNPPTKGAHPLAPTIHHGPVVRKKCSARTLQHNYRGRCVKGLQWLLTGQDPAYRPKRDANGANGDRKYWRIRTVKPTGLYGADTVKEVQKAKWRLGYPAGRANGAAGPKLRAYLLGRPLPSSYVDAKERRYQDWKKAQRHNPSPRLRHLMGLALQAIEWSGHYYYTQTYHRSDFLNGLGPPWPKGGDCSGSVSALYKLAGMPATGSAFPYDWTGSMQARGHIVWQSGQSLTRLKQGDLIFYGGRPNFTHVAMIISRDGSRVYTFGHQGCPCNASTLYRDDAQIARRYF